MKKLSAGKILVTGAAGFIGSHIVEEALKQGVHVVGIDNLVAGKLDNIQEALRSPYFEFRQAGVQHDLRLANLYPDVEVIFHNAASKCTVCRARPDVDLIFNALGTLRVAEAAQNIGAKLVHASTGSTNQGRPESYYGISKLAAEHYVKALGKEGLDFVILRYHHVFGPRQPYDDLGGVIPIFIRNTMWNQPIRIYGTGKQVRYFTFVEDVVNANFMAANAEMGNDTIDLASSEGRTILELAYTIREMVDKPDHPIIWFPRRIGDIDDFEISWSGMDRLGWDVKHNFKHNLQKTINWYTNHIRRFSCNTKGR
jgi:UDP-glucose 4-epimerase